ncbi:MAG: hypothetical protein QGF46_08850, partial [Planctomycetota bacterium]|nr:hypothetical protein [Planctomycetota bacterium]
MTNEHDWKLRTSAWFDNECSDIDAAEVRANLLKDNETRIELQTWRELRNDLSLLQAEDANAQLVSRMRDRFQQSVSAEAFSYSQALRYLNIAAALILALSIGGWIVINASAPDFEVYAQDAHKL